MGNNRRDDRTRLLLAQECAKIMAEEGVKDFRLAKRKAGERLGVSNRTSMPSNLEIEQALLEYQRLFQHEEQQRLHDLRQAAAETMVFLERFRPHLAGPVLRGVVSPHPEVQLHVFADTPEEILIFLMEKGIAFETSERRMRVGDNRHDCFPVVSFSTDEVTFDLIVFTDQGFREAPKSPVDGKPMRRANLTQVRSMLTE